MLQISNINIYTILFYSTCRKLETRNNIRILSCTQGNDIYLHVLGRSSKHNTKKNVNSTYKQLGVERGEVLRPNNSVYHSNYLFTITLRGLLIIILQRVYLHFCLNTDQGPTHKPEVYIGTTTVFIRETSTRRGGGVIFVNKQFGFVQISVVINGFKTFDKINIY